MENKNVLTVQPFRVVLQRPLEIEDLSSSRQIVEIRSKNDGISLGKFGIGTGIESRQISWITLLDPDRC